MIYDDVLQAAKRVLKELENTAPQDSGFALTDEQNPWHQDYTRLFNAVEELENLPETYWNVVAGAGDDILGNLNVDDDFDLEQQFSHAIHELENEHPWILNEDKAQMILNFSNYPSQEPSSFGSNGCFKGLSGTDQFPWGSLAAEAFAEDVKTYLRNEYDLEVINNENLQAVMEEINE